MPAPARKPDIVLRNGKPAQVILNIKDYEDLLERAEDADDLKLLKEMRKKPLRFRSLDDILREKKRV